MRLRYWVNSMMAAAIIAAAVVLWTEPVPYSVSCFDPDRNMRSLCHRQMTIIQLKMHLTTIQYAPPAFVRQNKEEILRGFEQFLRQGYDPEEVGMTPFQLRRMLQAIVEDYYGGEA